MTSFSPQRISIRPKDRDFIIDNFKSVMESGEFAYGTWTDKFEKAFSGVIGTRYAVATGSGTQALEISIRSLRLKGKRVAVPTNTYIASPQAVLHSGSYIHFVDSDVDMNMNPDSLPKVLDAVDAIMIVHIGGNITSRIREIIEYCHDRNIPLIEDAAHAHGSFCNVGKAGTIGRVSAFSFFPTKILTVGGEGGALCTDDPEIAQFAKRFRHHGRDAPGHAIGTYKPTIHGHNFCIDELRSIIGYTQVNRLREYIETRARASKVYKENFDLVESIGTNFYKIITLNSLDPPPFTLPSKVYSVPCHLQPSFGFKRGSYPTAEKLCDLHSCLPIYNDITEEEVTTICDSIKRSQQ